MSVNRYFHRLDSITHFYDMYVIKLTLKRNRIAKTNIKMILLLTSHEITGAEARLAQ